MNVALMRAKMKEKERLANAQQIECSKSFFERLKATLMGAKGKCTIFDSRFTIGIYSLLLPYILGFVAITILCFSLVDISLDSYFSILAESFSITGLWVIGYFILSVILFAYLFTTILVKRDYNYIIPKH